MAGSAEVVDLAESEGASRKPTEPFKNIFGEIPERFLGHFLGFL